MSRVDDLRLELTGLVYVRALLESTGATPEELSSHADAIERVRNELTASEGRSPRPSLAY
ncbi:MAG TPA: hypothetical protein VFB25_08675 [Gaiellaceae bacterium]|nr:hypothetical protein [Gaiellaceae bacterium]